MTNLLEKSSINNGFLGNSKFVDIDWVKKTISSDQKFQEILESAKNEKKISSLLNTGISISAKYKNIVFVGIGGSTLAGKSFYGLLQNDLKSNIYFIDNLDKKSINDTINKLPLKDSFFVFISKSGETIETGTQMCYIINTLKEAGLSKSISDKCLCVTQNKDSKMKKIAHFYQIEIVEWDGDVSGRFSAFSSNSNLINAILGSDVKKICKRFINSVDFFLSSENFLKHLNFTISSLKNSISSTVLMCYSDNMSNFIDWYIQLWAESIGKNNIGTNPCKAIGTIDQHSKLQLYLDGPKDKTFTLIAKKQNNSNDFNLSDFEKFGIKSGNIEYINNSLFQGTVRAIQNENLPIRSFEVDEFDINFLTDFMTFYFLETVLCCWFFEINSPYDQPKVELAKKFFNV